MSIKKIFIVFFLALGLTACGAMKKVNEASRYQMIGIEMQINQAQLDSICIADTLVNNLKDWANAVYYDYETNTAVVKRTLVKGKGMEQTVYVIEILNDSTYTLSKRYYQIIDNPILKK